MIMHPYAYVGTKMELIERNFKSVEKPQLTIQDIKAKVCKYYGVTLDQIYSGDRHTTVKNARHLIAYLARKELCMHLKPIAKELKLKDHTSVINAIRKVEGYLSYDQDFRKQVNEVRDMIYN